MRKRQRNREREKRKQRNRFHSNAFWSSITFRRVIFDALGGCNHTNPEAVARRCSVKKVLLEISQNSQENTRARVSFLKKFIRKATVAHVFSCEFCLISKNNFFAEHLRTATSEKMLQFRDFFKFRFKYKANLTSIPSAWMKEWKLINSLKFA